MIYAKDIIKLCHGEVIGNKEITLDNFIIDSRKIEKDDVYVAIVGENNDGNKYTESALEKGAKAVIISNPKYVDINKYQDKTIIIVTDTLKCLQELARYKRSLYQGKVIAITGSVGKTSTKDMVSALLQSKYKVHKTQGNMNNHLGLPLTILSLKDEDILVVEMGMNHFGEISTLTNIAKPNIAIITNIGTAHIGNLGSRENILKAKLEILEGMKIPKIIINNDNDLLHNWYKENSKKIEIHTFGIKNSSEIMGTNIKMQEESSEFTAVDGFDKIKIKVPVGGEHFVYNALCAIAVGRMLDISTEKIQQGIECFELTKKRMDIKKLENGAMIINDAYNASFESMKVSLEFLANHTGKRKIAVLGDMFELGEYSEELHRKVGKEVVKNNIDVLICAGENAKYIIEEVKKDSNIETHFMHNNEEIVENLSQKLRKGDVVLVKASNGMKFFEICQKL